MTEMLSAGVYTQEIDQSTITPTVSNTVAAYSGKFNMGSVGALTLNTSVADLISNHGYPTDENYNHWFQAFNFLQYGNKLLISRAANYKGSTERLDSVVVSVPEDDKVNVSNYIEPLTMIQFPADGAENIYLVLSCENYNLIGMTEGTEFCRYDSHIYTFYDPVIDGERGVFGGTWDFGDGTRTLYVAAGANNTKHRYDEETYPRGTVIEVKYTSDNGDSFYGSFAMNDQDIYGTAPDTTTGWIIQVERDLDTDNIPSVGANIDEFSRDMNGLIEVGDETCYTDVVVGDERYYSIYDAPVVNENEYFVDNKFVGNATDFDTKESSIVFTNPAASKLKFISRNPGAWCEDLKICVAKPESFYANSLTPADHVTKYAFEGLPVDQYFEYAPTGTEFAIIVMLDGDIVETFTVDTSKTAKDSNNKTTYVENVINVNSSYLFVKDNTSLDTVADTTLFYDAPSGDYVGAPLELLFSTDSDIQQDDLIDAMELFENKEEIDVDIIIANELDGGSSAQNISKTREDCISFIGANYEDCVGLKSSVATLKLIDWRVGGDVSTDNMFATVFGNYKYQYDQYNDVYRWVNLAGDIAGLRAQTTMDRASWWASAGLERGKIKNVTKLAFNPTVSMRDLLYKNAINPCVVFPGMGAVCWGQKTLYSKASSFDRVNVRGLFNTLERSLAKMAKYQVMEFNDTFTRNRIISMIKPYLASVQAGRGIQDFLVICDESNNTDTVIANNQLLVDIYIKPTYVAEFILLRFTNAGTNSFSSIVS